MNRRELVLKKIHELPDSEVAEAIEQLTYHVNARMRFNSKFDRTKSGAHGENNLGMNAIDYYVGESIRKLYDPNGWDWKFEKLTLGEQLTRIANKIISDKVESYKAKKDGLPVFDTRDASEIYDLETIQNDDFTELEKICTRLISIATEISKDDDDLHYFTMRYFEKADFSTIASEMNIDIKQIYVLRRKLVRRLEKHKEIITT